VAGAAHRIDLGSYQLLGEDLHHLAQRIGVSALSLLAEGRTPTRQSFQ
jgi:hypothetical protein